ncbi:MAG: PPC domain-containing protein, partial [Planctomycetes bacterium]|nr:PPC domain-containing protein [Planctomycetota bacterium]
MKRIDAVGLFAVCCLLATPLQAQTPYPMFMSLKPVAAMTGQSSEHEVNARYSMHGAYRVLVSGEGVSGEVITPMEMPKDGKRPSLTKIKIRFKVAADAKPGVRDFRIATPQGVSTLGQMVIVRDPVVVEKGSNNTAEQAQQITVPATVCGAIEKNEDVDNFKFQVEAGMAFTFHVRSMRLQDRIHDLQKHSDPILTIRNSSGTTLAQSDNYFAGDPFLSYTFQDAGEYLLEIRDVRFKGNKYWEYSIEISNRPFVSNVFPLGVSPGQESRLLMVGFQLPDDPMTTLTIPAKTPPGPQRISLPMGDDVTNPVPVVISDLPVVVEAESNNNSPSTAQPISVPAGISGRIETEADIDCFRFEAKKGEKYSFEVIARRQGSALDSILRILDAKGKQLSENDDLRLYKRNFSDSWIENWTAPADGTYVIEIRDLHLRGGDSFLYFLRVTRSVPYFELYLDTDKTQLTPGTGGVFFVNSVRKNGFAGEIQLQIDGLPEGVTASCGRIPAGERDGCILLQSAPGSKMAVSNVTISGTATHPLNEKESLQLVSTAVPYQETYQPGGGRGHWPVEMHTVSIGEASDIRNVTLSVNNLTIKPGESKRIEVTIERAPGFTKNVQLDMLYRHLSSVYGNTLPPGVTMDSKNSKTLLTAKESKGHITLKAAANAKPMEKRQVSVMANISLNFGIK